MNKLINTHTLTYKHKHACAPFQKLQHLTIPNRYVLDKNQCLVRLRQNPVDTVQLIAIFQVKENIRSEKKATIHTPNRERQLSIIHHVYENVQNVKYYI